MSSPFHHVGSLPLVILHHDSSVICWRGLHVHFNLSHLYVQCAYHYVVPKNYYYYCYYYHDYYYYYYYYYYFLSFFLSCYSDDPCRVPGTRKTARGELQKPNIEPWTAVPKGADLQILLTAGLVRHRMHCIGNPAQTMRGAK